MSIEGPTGEHEPMESQVDDAQGSPEGARKQIDFSIDDNDEELTRIELVPIDEEYESW
ncbi:MAG TPA: hypothetical protein VK694_03440 [Verrucomicrobiae bacterium]|nr:hypothetical protein [Verrucomicrobiae bacterium]